ncbi:MAG: hypothetical protein CVV18_01470 [Gammaproteobacteria bacterium HGW-Gammaproteobacteria-8]|nr:MAG: hypothetical protein CVV18_01470 [Gammaproteobacteria bacterium HGW-Gammaproteobacteria-8]
MPDSEARAVGKVSQFLCTDTGVVRTRNEDNLLARPEVGLWVVCDGMGGHDAGDYASGHIVDALDALVLPPRHGERVQAIRRCLGECNRHLLEYAQAHGFAHVGSTVVVLCMQDRRAAVIWVGDSRVYLLRNQHLRQVSRDHSVAEELADCGLIQPGENLSAITRAVGAAPELLTDLALLESRPGDTWLLCSDGVSGVLSDSAIASLLCTASDPAGALVAAAIEAGSRDNCTALVLRM